MALFENRNPEARNRDNRNPGKKSAEKTGRGTFPRNRLLDLAALVLMALSAWRPAAFAQTAAMPPASLREPLDAVAPEKRNEVVATVNGEEITREILFWYNTFWQRSGFTATDVLNLPPKELEKLVEDVALTRVGARRAQEPDSGVVQETLDATQEQRDDFIVTLLEEREIDAKLGAISAEEIRTFYEQNSEAFKIPFTFSIRHIFVSTYQSVQTKPGDTLEGLAREISGDESKVDYILLDSDAKAPRAPGYSKGERVTIKPLEPGEYLLVPISEKAKPERRKKIEAAMERLRAGDNFTSVALEYSENASKGEIIYHVEQAGKPVLPEIARQVKATPVGQFSDIFETKHGYNIMQVVQKTEERVPAIEEMEPAIQNYLQDQKRGRMRDDYTKALYAIPELKIDLERIKDPATPEDAPVVTLEGKSYPRKRFVLENLGETAKDMRDEDVLPLIQADTKLRKDLKAFRGRQLGLDKTAECKGKVLGLVERTLRDAYLQAVGERLATEEISPEDAKKFFESHREEFILLSYYTFYVLALRVENPDDAQAVRAMEARARDLMLPVKTLDQFKRVIEAHGEQFPNMREKGLMENVPEVELGPALAQALQSLKVGEMATPVFQKPFVMTPWLVNRTLSRQATYEEIEPRLPAMVRERRLRTFPDDQIEELLKEATIVLR